MESRLVYTQSQWNLVLAGFVLAFFALLAAFVYLLSSRSELSSKYRPAGSAGAMVAMVAAVAYLLIVASWIVGFDYDPATGTYAASDAAFQFRNGYRYVDWTVTVPLLCAEMIGVAALSGARAKNVRFTWMTLAVVMIVTGYLGEETLGHIAQPNQSTAQFLVWGLISTAAFVPLYVGILREAFRSARILGEPTGAHLRNAAFVLSFTWGVYPLAYLVPLFFPDSPGWAVGRQLAFTVADIAAKVGYGFLIHAAAKARTATDVARGESPHPEAVYINSEKMAEAQPAAPAARVHAEFGHPYDGAGDGAHSGVGHSGVGHSGLREARGEV